MENKGTKIAGRIVDENDSEWNDITHCQIVTENQGGVRAGTGNYMQVDGGAVSTNGISTNQKTHFKIHSILDDGYRKVVILENEYERSVVAIKQADDSVIAKRLPTSPSDYTSLKQVETAHPEILFYQEYREPTSEYFYFKSYLKDKQRILGFNENGIALNPTLVQSTQKECLFSTRSPPSSPSPSPPPSPSPSPSPSP